MKQTLFSFEKAPLTVEVSIQPVPHLLNKMEDSIQTKESVPSAWLHAGSCCTTPSH